MKSVRAAESSRAAAPVGPTIRPYRGEGDVPDFVRIINAEYEADRVAERVSEEGERAWLAVRSEKFDPLRDLVFAELDRRPVGLSIVNWADARDGSARHYGLWGAVEPAARRRGVGSALLADGERRARALASTHDTDLPRVFTSWAGEGRPGARLLERFGYEPVRWFVEMIRPSLEGAEEVPLPDGFELRPVEREQYPLIWQGNREAFRDHWGASDESAEAMRRFFESPNTDPALWLIAWDGDQVAGGVINSIHANENELLGVRRGWLDNVFTRRPWRQRGLARALMLRSLVLLRERGMTSAALSVDTDNSQGALGLYEAAGFEVFDRFIAWRRPMDEQRS